MVTRAVRGYWRAWQNGAYSDDIESDTGCAGPESAARTRSGDPGGNRKRARPAVISHGARHGIRRAAGGRPGAGRVHGFSGTHRRIRRSVAGADVVVRDSTFQNARTAEGTAARRSVRFD